MTLKSGKSKPACAACKYQRRKCTSQCVLASYFPADEPKKFQNAHRLFGVRNIMKIVEKLDGDDQKADAMKSVIFEADMREKFPVYGCVECIFYLRQQLQLALQELQYVYAQLALYREQHDHLDASSSINCCPSSHLNLGLSASETFTGESNQGIAYLDYDMLKNQVAHNQNSFGFLASNHVGIQEQQEISRDFESLTLINYNLVDDR